MSGVDLRVDWCEHKAAEYAVMHWHYSKRMPIGKLVKVGAWEDGRFIGAIIFARGSTPTLGDAYDIEQIEVCELVRVALAEHSASVSQIAAACIKKLKNSNDGLRLIVSYADPFQGHIGTIYQAMNWIYVGDTKPELVFWHEGRWKHRREVVSQVTFGRQKPMLDYKNLRSELRPGKHKYLCPLDRAMRKQIAPLAKPYPKRLPCGQSVEGDTSGDQPEGASSILAARSEFE